MIDTIKKLYKEVNKKQEFIAKAATAFGMKPTSLRTHWVGGFWSIPEDKQAKMKRLLEKTIKEQNKKISA